VAVNDCSRIALTAMTRNEQKADAVGLLEQVVAYYRRRGVRVQRVMTYNGGCFRSHAVAAACQRLGIRHAQTKTCRPQTHGKAARFSRPALRTWAYAVA
jgi:transposase InsO family protein